MSEVSEEDGKMAFELISDYPLYANTAGITYGEGVAIAIALFGKDWKKELEEEE